MVQKSCIKRLEKEYRAICKEPVPHVLARPSPNDILEWHYVLEGSEGTPFEGGFYYGKIKFPPEYPFKPPGITMTTPNGRFMTQKKICLSMSDFHPESWNPMWSVSSILTGLLSFMVDSNYSISSVNTTVSDKQRLAMDSLAFNCNMPGFRKMFPEYVERQKEKQQAKEEKRSAEVKGDCDSLWMCSGDGKEGDNVESGGGSGTSTTTTTPFILLLFAFSLLGGVLMAYFPLFPTSSP